MSFIMADTEHVGIGRVIERAQAAAQSFAQGAACLIDANGAWAECGANPALIGGFSLSAAGTDTSGFNILGVKGFPPGFMQCIWPGNERRFLCRYIGALPGVLGAAYDIIRDSDTLWKINFGSTANTRLRLIGWRTPSPENLPLVEVVVLSANVQQV